MRKHGVLWLVIALASQALGDRAEFALGGEDGNPWTIPLALEGEEGGFYTVYGCRRSNLTNRVGGHVPSVDWRRYPDQLRRRVHDSVLG